MAKIPVTDCPAGPALDAAVAKALGWRIARWSDETDGGFQLTDEHGNYVRPWSADKDPKWRWSPSTDIAAAWELVKSSDCSVDLVSAHSITASRKRWAAFFVGKEDTSIGYADTAPLAITRAFLLAHGVTEVEVPDD